ncbi:MAG TPA: hypothetical protein PK344_15900 [Syntrophorhabdaceae bacterium]|nr:hypothetical protein [Syntrophorhabdaceae bacterium]
MSSHLLDLTYMLASLKLLEPQSSVSQVAFDEHIASLKDEVDFVIPRLLDLQKRLKDVGG